MSPMLIQSSLISRFPVTSNFLVVYNEYLQVRPTCPFMQSCAGKIHKEVTGKSQSLLFTSHSTVITGQPSIGTNMATLISLMLNILFHLTSQCSDSRTRNRPHTGIIRNLLMYSLMLVSIKCSVKTINVLMHSMNLLPVAVDWSTSAGVWVNSLSHSVPVHPTQAEQLLHRP